MREKFKKKFYEFKKLLFLRNTAPFVLAEPLQLYNKSLFRSFCSAKLQRALVLLFHRNTAPFVLAEPFQLYINAHSAAFAAHNCSEHSFYCFTGIPHLSCSHSQDSASRKINASLNIFPANCIPIGMSSFDVRPAGTLIEGIRARFTNVVYKSDKYISRGLSTFEPSLNAAVGQVGQRIIS